MNARLAINLALCSWLVACGRLNFEGSRDAQTGSPEASTDARVDPPDASRDAAMDARTLDAAVPDSAAMDATSIDATVMDAIVMDAIAIDATATDATVMDAAAVDATTTDAAVTDATVVDASVDAGPWGDLPCTAASLWQTEFDSDPTQLDLDNNSMSDWIVRGGGPFPVSELSNGVWTSAGQVPLDSNPPTNIVNTVYVDARLRSVRPPAPVASGYEGALFWVNVDYTPTDFAPLFVSVARTAVDEQEVRFYGKTADAVTVLLIGPTTIGPDFVHVRMEIDPATSTLTGWIDGISVGSAMFPRVTDVINNDRFATAFAASTPAEFDFARVVLCVP